ncbi:hypothetical protein [Novosphingobium resinovorum]|uniref:6-carboxy-5,6,7,8-tetrahydropterin synthase n=1 Tax=Novosphingobium resinovorum TaxID=158500 RepID=A0A1D8A375_9SPHN|nr:hypothetical protein [Novosphingobium resinovorum]AOR76512.1 hypothetical protein BES08_06975 [Novosphingobium resinovorum]
MLTYAEAQFCGIHKAPYSAFTHGHDFWVRVTWKDAGDFRLWRDTLDDEIAGLDHADLNELLGDKATNEGVAAYLGAILGAVTVEVWRFDRGRRFGAIWQRDGQ